MCNHESLPVLFLCGVGWKLLPSFKPEFPTRIQHRAVNCQDACSSLAESKQACESLIPIQVKCLQVTQVSGSMLLSWHMSPCAAAYVALPVEAIV